MVNSISNLSSSAFSALFGTSTGGASTSFGVDASVLVAWASAKAGIGGDVVEVGADPNAPTPPWTPGLTARDPTLAANALAGRAFFDPRASIYADVSMEDDYRQLFALYQGLSTMSALAGAAENEDASALQRSKTQAAFARGVAELTEYLGGVDFEAVNLAAGDRVDQAVSRLGVPVADADYVTRTLVRGSLTSLVPGLPSNAAFTMVAITPGGTERRVDIDLADMGSTPRSLGGIVSFINNRLSAAGVATRVEAVNQAPKTQSVRVGGQTVERTYRGPGEWALKIDSNAGERISFEAIDGRPAFYLAGQTLSGGRLMKIEDTDGAPGQPYWIARPTATQTPQGALIATGFMGPGGAYQSAPDSASEWRTGALMMDGDDSATESVLREAGEAVLKLRFADGRALTISTGWRAEDLEGWRIRAGQSADEGLLDDLSERLTQLLHEQGVAAGLDIWADGTDVGLSVFAADGVSVEALTIGGRSVALNPGRDPIGGYVGGLRGGVFARRFESQAVAPAGALFTEAQRFTFETTSGTKVITIDGGEDGIDAAALVAQLNQKLREKDVAAAVSLVDEGGALTLRFDATHAVTEVSATINEDSFELALAPPGAWANGGLPNAASGEPFGDNRRTYRTTGASPLLTETGALDIAIVVETASGPQTVNVAVSADERLANPDAAPGEWNALFQQRLDAALNAAGLYIGALGADFSGFIVAEGAGQRLSSVSINGQALDFAADAPAFGVGGAMSAQRSFTADSGAASVSDDVQALIDDPTVSLSIETIWGARTISASLDPGDPRTLESAALRLNEALAAAGYDLGVAAVPVAGGGAGVRVVAGATDTIARVASVSLGADIRAATLDPIDSISAADDPVGAQSVAARASRNAAVIATDAYFGSSPYAAPAVNAGNWFAGRAFDTGLGQGANVSATRATAVGADGSVYVLADVTGLMGDQTIAADTDVALLKYDSAGKLIFARALGASESAEGFALAVSASGKVAVAGAVSGALGGVSGEAGGADSVVTMFDADGVELWTQRRGAAKDDSVRQLAFAANDVLIVSGVVNGAMQGQASAGGVDAYVRGYSASGVTLFTKQYGTGGEDTSGALLVRDGVGGAVEIFTAGVESNRGIVRSFTYSGSAGLSVGASRDIGLLQGGAINALVSDGSALYVGGGAGADRLTIANSARGGIAGQDGFVARLDDDLLSTALDRVTYLGSAQDDVVTGLAFADGALYATGRVTGVIAGLGAAKTASSFIARLDDAGDIGWARSFLAGSGSFQSMANMAVDAGGASALDALGLPRGEIQTDESRTLAERAAVRVGDQFSVAVGDSIGRRITIAANDTMQTLARKIQSAIGLSGNARVIKDGGTERIEITARDGRVIRLSGGPEGKNALPALGLPEGIIARNSDVRGAIRTFGLGLIARDLSLKDADAIKAAKADLAAALSIIKSAYEAIANPNAKQPTAEERARQARASGPAPEYLTQQLANYRAALSRLGG